MIELADLGFQKGVIVETIVSTFNVDGTPNAAPMGITMENAKQVNIKLFIKSSTYKNLKSKNCAVINITSDIQMFFKTTFKEVNPKSKVPMEWFEKAETVEAPKLCRAEAIVEVSVVNIKSINQEKAEIVCNATLVKARQSFPKAHCRAFSETLEAIIHATRVKSYFSGSEGQQKQTLELIEKIENCHGVVNRVAPNSCYSKIMVQLEKMISLWRSKA